jgi:hypothetical protein
MYVVGLIDFRYEFGAYAACPPVRRENVVWFPSWSPCFCDCSNSRVPFHQANDSPQESPPGSASIPGIPNATRASLVTTVATSFRVCDDTVAPHGAYSCQPDAASLPEHYEAYTVW